MKHLKMFEDFTNEAMSASDKKALKFTQKDQDPKKLKILRMLSVKISQITSLQQTSV